MRRTRFSSRPLPLIPTIHRIRIAARTNDPLDDADAESIEDPADNPEVTTQKEQRLSTMNLCCKPTT